VSIIRGLVGTLAVGALALGSLGLPFAAVAADEPGVPDATMGDYPDSRFAAEAARMPDALVDALADNPGVTPIEYLAQAQAGVDAAAVLDSLEANGVEVLGSRLDDATLVVNVATSADARAVAATGAVPDRSAPVIPDYSTDRAKLMTDISGGQAFYYEDNGGYRCSVGFTGFNKATGAPVIATAGHCQNDGYGNGGYYDLLTQPRPLVSTGFTFTGKHIGRSVPGSFLIGDGYDVGLIAVGGGWTPKPRVTTWNGGSGAPTTFTDVWDVAPAIVGATVCKSGATSGWTCGKVIEVDAEVEVGSNDLLVDSVVTTACMLGGDSGGSGLMGHLAVGINSWGTADRCGNPWSPTNRNGDISGFSTIVSENPSVSTLQTRVGDQFEIGVAVAAPALTSTRPVPMLQADGALSGTLANAGVRHSVEVYLDGATQPIVVPVDQAGAWSVPLEGLADGVHTVSLRGAYGLWSRGARGAARPFLIGAPRLLAALDSDSPAAASAAIAQQDFAGTAPVVYLATGSNPEDTLSAISAGMLSGGPVLLTRADELPEVVASEIRRLAPGRIVIAGDATAVTDAVIKRLYSLAPTVVRMARPQLDAVPLSVALAAPFNAASATQVYTLDGLEYVAPAAPVAARPVATPPAAAPVAELPLGQPSENAIGVGVPLPFGYWLFEYRDPRLEALRR